MKYKIVPTPDWENQIISEVITVNSNVPLSWMENNFSEATTIVNKDRVYCSHHAWANYLDHLTSDYQLFLNFGKEKKTEMVLICIWHTFCTSWWDICLIDAKVNKPMSVAIIKPTNSMTDCSWEVDVRYFWIFRSIFAPWYCWSAWFKANSFGQCKRRKKVACFNIMITALRKVNYTL